MDDSKTVWCGNLSDKVTEEILYELFLQAAPLERVRIPTDKEGRKSNFAFITFKHEQSVDYALQLMNGMRLYDKSLNVKPRNTNSYGGNRPPDLSMQSRIGNMFQLNQYQNRSHENRENPDSRGHFRDRDEGPRGHFRDNYENRENLDSRGQFRDNYRDEGPRGQFRDNYREDRHRDNSFNRHDDRDRHNRHDSNRRRANFNERRGSFNDRGNRNRNRYY